MKKSLLFSFFSIIAICSLQAQMYNVTLQVDMRSQIPADTISVVGNMQLAAGYPADWTPGSTLLMDADNDTIYDVTLSLPAGTYQCIYAGLRKQALDAG